MGDSVLRPDSIIRALHSAFCRDVSRQELLQLAATKLQRADTRYAGVYLYLARGDNLELEAFAGPPREVGSVPADQPVASDLTVPVRLHDKVLGQIAIDRDTPDALSEAQGNAVQEVADALATLL